MRTRRSPRNQHALYRALTPPTPPVAPVEPINRCWDCLSYPAGGRSRGACTLVGEMVAGRNENRACFRPRHQEEDGIGEMGMLMAGRNQLPTRPVLVDMDATLKALEVIVEHYERSAPTVSAYADELYIRINDRAPVQLGELLLMQELFGEDGLMHPNYAANRVYKLMAALGMDTTGHAGY